MYNIENVSRYAKQRGSHDDDLLSPFCYTTLEALINYINMLSQGFTNDIFISLHSHLTDESLSLLMEWIVICLWLLIELIYTIAIYYLSECYQVVVT